MKLQIYFFKFYIFTILSKDMYNFILFYFILFIHIMYEIL
jgi:hypothetical protein